MKHCIRCKKLKPIERYYKHSQMADGHLNKCKDCCIEQQMKRTRAGLTQAYDRKRSLTLERKAYFLKAQRKRRAIYPEKNIARSRLRYALKIGKVQKTSCVFCGNEKSEAHHPDYSKPLYVIWLCKLHHELQHHVWNTPKNYRYSWLLQFQEG